MAGRKDGMDMLTEEQMHKLIKATRSGTVYEEMGLLYIYPSANVLKEPLIDGLTKKMTAAFRQAGSPPWGFAGVHICACGVCSECHDFILPGGIITNSLCVHYLAYHRGEVPPAELEKVLRLSCGEEVPTEEELHKPVEGYVDHTVDAIMKLAKGK